MTFNSLVRQSHRWISVLFFIAVGVASYAAATGQSAESMLYYLPLPPLFFMMVTGVYLFVLPYVVRARRGTTSV